MNEDNKTLFEMLGAIFGLSAIVAAIGVLL